jgi:uncharacterized protein YdiU (UPF0061 family)
METKKDTLTIECLVQSLQNVIEAKTEHDKARDDYDGYSWGYHGRYLVDAMENAARDFEERLETYIDQAIQRRLGSLSNKSDQERKSPASDVSKFNNQPNKQ